MVDELNLKQKRILKVLVSREKDIASDREEFLTEGEWRTYNSNLDAINNFLGDVE